LKKMIATWAKGKGLEHALSCQAEEIVSSPYGFGAADAVIFTNLKKALGLDKAKYCFTGAAPIRKDTLAYFGSLGLPLYEAYGMTECCAVCTLSIPQLHQWGSVGIEVAGVEVRAFKVDPDDINKKEPTPLAPSINAAQEEHLGEVCFRGRNNMMGYMANPDFGEEHCREIERKTAETIDKEGWIHSGDQGFVTTKGLIKLTGRYKELIIGSGGENIAPIPIEDHVKMMCDGINEMVMIGDHQKYNVALITLKAKDANGDTPGTDELAFGATLVNPNTTTISAALDDPVWIEAVTAAIKSANTNPKICRNNAFTVQKFTILPTNFSIQENELTPTRKIKRKTVNEKYKKCIAGLYSIPGVYVPYSKLLA